MIENRSLATCIILSIVTCGIYGIYWYYCILKDLYTITGQENKAATDIVLGIVTCGIYTIYIAYQMGKLVDKAYMQFGFGSKDDSIMYLILSVLGLGIVVYAIVQAELNDTIGPAYNSNMGGGMGGYTVPQDNVYGVPQQPPVDSYQAPPVMQSPIPPVQQPEVPFVPQQAPVIETIEEVVGEVVEDAPKLPEPPVDPEN